MHKLLAAGKSDLLQFVSARTRRPFSAFLVRQPDGKIGFEFEARAPGSRPGRATARTAAALRVIGAHPKDRQPVELHNGRYGPYVRHNGVNATLPAAADVEGLTLDDAVALLAAKASKSPGTGRTARPARASASRGGVATAAKSATTRTKAVATARKQVAPGATPRVAAKGAKRTAATPAPRATKVKTPVRRRRTPA
jgi:hypothetical protein